MVNDLLLDCDSEDNTRVRRQKTKMSEQTAANNNVEIVGVAIVEVDVFDVTQTEDYKKRRQRLTRAVNAPSRGGEEEETTEQEINRLTQRNIPADLPQLVY